MKKNKSIQDMIIDGELTRRQAITAIKNKLRRKSELMILKDGKKKKLWSLCKRCKHNVQGANRHHQKMDFYM